MNHGSFLVQQLEQEERDCMAELQSVRVRGRQLKLQLAKLNLKLALKDQLQLDTGNLHSVDYEQLKMENESLNAKASPPISVLHMLSILVLDD